MVGWLAVQPVVGENFNQKIWLVIIIYTVVVWSAAWRPGAGWFQMVSNGFKWFQANMVQGHLYGGSLQFTTCVKI